MLAHVEPSSATAIAILVVCLVLVFRFESTNGFHDPANAVAPRGVASATLICVFVAASGDKDASRLGSIGRAALICVFGVLLFHFVLQVPMPVLKFSGWSLL